jgi:hypothetical protein
MNPFEQALDIATRMREALQTELAAARDQRVLVRKLDVQGLFERARRRGEFNIKLAQMQGALGEALAAVAAALGTAKVTLEVLRASETTSAEALAEGLSELRASAQALQEIDNFNQGLGKRALACVRGYLSALSPRADAYDRFGGIRGDNVATFVRQVA